MTPQARASAIRAALNLIEEYRLSLSAEGFTLQLTTPARAYLKPQGLMTADIARVVTHTERL